MGILTKIKPTSEEEKQIKELANRIIRTIKIREAEVELGGSAAKGTNLRGAHDLDIYVKFNKDIYSNSDISGILKNELEKIFPQIETVHGSRDYFQLNEEGFLIEIIPILEIKKAEDATNITDVSPLHVKWVRKHKKYANEIRLSKAFCKANNIYGAETYVKGFSGYVLEILTIRYKSFLKLLRAVSKWKKKTVIDHEKFYKNEKEVLNELNSAKSLSPLILIDPVQKTRNAAAVLNEENYANFVSLAKKYLKKPSEKFFEKKELDLLKLKEKAKGNKFVVLEAEALEGKKDVVGTKLLKCFEYMQKKLANEEFKVIRSGWSWNSKAYLWFVIKNEKLSETKKHFGPPIKEKNRLKDFKEKWKGHKIFSLKRFVYVELERGFREPEPYLADLIEKDVYIKSRVKQVTRIEV
ncbi:CCA tRNA nucleotidyltransferase [Candidatus Woesearchaeota archaeon]|nr:CCA tRNA nucleotidyltransferase [Candidatus Woesearchaeota archaeon]